MGAGCSSPGDLCWGEGWLGPSGNDRSTVLSRSTSILQERQTINKRIDDGLVGQNMHKPTGHSRTVN